MIMWQVPLPAALLYGEAVPMCAKHPLTVPPDIDSSPSRILESESFGSDLDTSPAGSADSDAAEATINRCTRCKACPAPTRSARMIGGVCRCSSGHAYGDTAHH